MVLMLADLKEGDEFISMELVSKQHFTQPPPRYTEAILVNTLEELGIGRPTAPMPLLWIQFKREFM